MKKTILTAAMIMALGITCAAGAAPAKNPYGLVYNGAITQNMVGQVNIHPVSYSLHGVKIAANVYTPANYNKNKSYPAIVIAHPICSTLDAYAAMVT